MPCHPWSCRDRRRWQQPKGTSLFLRVLVEKLLNHFRPIRITEYIGITYSENHICRFENVFFFSIDWNQDSSTSLRISMLYFYYFVSNKRYYKPLLEEATWSKDSTKIHSAFQSYYQNNTRMNTVLEVSSATLEIPMNTFSQGWTTEDDFFRKPRKQKRISPTQCACSEVNRRRRRIQRN